MTTILLSIIFFLLLTIELINPEARLRFFNRSKEEWMVDWLGLIIQGLIIPAVPFLVVPLLQSIFPRVFASIELHFVWQFILSFFVIDYLYYWNHRIFHKRQLWMIHRLHHSSRHLDIIATSRNSFLTSFLFVYVWSQVLAMFLFKDATGFLLGLALTFALDLWRHSGLNTPQFLQNVLGWFLIMPEQHVLHHSLVGRNKNFGANIVWWDKWHGTFSTKTVDNQNLEKLSSKNILSELFTPWSSK